MFRECVDTILLEGLRTGDEEPKLAADGQAFPAHQPRSFLPAVHLGPAPWVLPMVLVESQCTALIVDGEALIRLLLHSHTRLGAPHPLSSWR